MNSFKKITYTALVVLLFAGSLQAAELKLADAFGDGMILQREIPAPTVDGRVKLRVLVDRASLELFINDGQAAASFTVIPDPKNRDISLTGDAALKIASLEVNELKSMWTNETGK